MLLEEPVHTPFDQYQREQKINQLWNEFVQEAIPIAKQIILEAHYPPAHRTIEPITKSVGGIAGGEKYFAKNMFFKFSIDYTDLYGGNQFAKKVAGNTSVWDFC